MTTHNVLGYENAYALRCWLEGRRDHAQTTTAGALATEAAEALGFHVTEGNIGRTRRDIGIVMRKKPEPKAAEVNEIRVLAQAIVHLASATGQLLPDDVHALAK